MKRGPGRPCRKDSENAYKRTRFAKTMIEDAEHTQPTVNKKKAAKKPTKGRKKAADKQTPTSSVNGNSSPEAGQHEIQYQADPNAALGLNVSAEAYVASSMQKTAASRARNASQAMQNMQQDAQTPMMAPQSPASTPSPYRTVAPNLPVPQQGGSNVLQASSFVQGQADNPFEDPRQTMGNGAHTSMIAMQPAVPHNVAMQPTAQMIQNVDTMAHRDYMQPQNVQPGMARARQPMSNGLQQPTIAMQSAVAQHAVQSPVPMPKDQGNVAQQAFMETRSIQKNNSAQRPMPDPQQKNLPGWAQAQKARQQRQQLQTMGPLPPAMRNGTTQGTPTAQKRKADEPRQSSPDRSKRQNTGVAQTPAQQTMGPAVGMQACQQSPMPQHQMQSQMVQPRQVPQHEPQNTMANTQSEMDMSIDDGTELEGEIERLEQANMMLQNEIQDNKQKMRRLRQSGMGQTPVYQGLLQQNASFKSQIRQNDDRLEELQDMLDDTAGMGMDTPQRGQMPVANVTSTSQMGYQLPSVNMGFMHTTTPQHAPTNQSNYQAEESDGEDLVPAGEVGDNDDVYSMSNSHTDMSSHFAGGFGNGPYMGHGGMN